MQMSLAKEVSQNRSEAVAAAEAAVSQDRQAGDRDQEPRPESHMF